MASRNLEARLRRLEQWGEGARLADARHGLPDWLLETFPSPLAGETASDCWRYVALPAQQQFHSDVATRFKGYSGPIGSGKSHALTYEAIFLSHLNPGLLGFIGAPTYPMLRDSTQRAFFEVLETEKIAYTFHKQQNKVRSRKRLGNHLPQPR